MARLTNKEYFLRRKFLQELWDHEETQQLYALLSVNKQQSLHSYYATAKYDWSDSELLEYRKGRDNGEAFSSGKAFNELYRLAAGAAIRLGIECNYIDLKVFTKKIPKLDKKLREFKLAEQRQKVKGYKTEHKVLPLVRQEIDVEKLAMAVMMIAEDMARKKRAP